MVLLLQCFEQSEKYPNGARCSCAVLLPVVFEKEMPMLASETEKLYPASKTLVRDKVASRIHAKDHMLYAFDEGACECAADFMGWADLGTNPPYPCEKIQAFAAEAIADGIETVLLIGQGGSTQAPMTITKYNKIDRNAVDFKVLDSVSPVRVRTILTGIDLEKTLVLVSSKSGGTIEMRSVLDAVIDHFAESMPAERVASHLVAITDPGSGLEARARSEHWRACFPGEPTVGGRFSALSVFGLVPGALAGIDLADFLGHAKEAEAACSEDAVDNPAIALASFLFDNYLAGRDKFCFFTPKRGRVLGLWIEQLVAESLGKNGLGILPNIEIDTLLLAEDPKDRCVITYSTKTDLWDERKNFDLSLAYLDDAIPRLSYRIESVAELAEHFVMWEYATAMCGYLLKVCPFDQPDVASTKAAALKILEEGQPAPDFEEPFIGHVHMGEAEVTMAPCVKADTLMDALYRLFSSVQPGDYFALNAFLPFDGEGRREALETIRHGVADKLGVASCLEIGPRYLHSTGQLHKGGPNKGVFLLISADELKDIPLSNVEAESLGTLAKAQAAADLSILIDRGRRCMHLHLPDNSGVTIRALGDAVTRVLYRIDAEREAAAAKAAAEAEEDSSEA